MCIFTMHRHTIVCRADFMAMQKYEWMNEWIITKTEVGKRIHYFVAFRFFLSLFISFSWSFLCTDIFVYLVLTKYLHNFELFRIKFCAYVPHTKINCALTLDADYGGRVHLIIAVNNYFRIEWTKDFNLNLCTKYNICITTRATYYRCNE